MIYFHDDTKTKLRNAELKTKMDHNASAVRLITAIVSCVTATVVCGATIASKLK